MFTYDTSDRVLISKFYKELIQINTQKTTNLLKKWEKDLIRTLLHRGHTDEHHTYKKIPNVTNPQRNAS